MRRYEQIADVYRLKVTRTPQPGERLPLRGSLGLVAVVTLCAFVLVAWQDDGLELRRAVLVSAIVCGSLCVGCLLMDWAIAHRTATVEEYAPRVQAQAPPLVLRPLAVSARDGLRFAKDALICIDGRWVERRGGASLEAMKARGWQREDWEQARDWLIAQGYLRWKGAERRLGTAWNLEAVSGWLNRSMQCATVQDSGES